jgi:hypothetical protein
MIERTPEEWLRHAQSLRDAAEDGRKLGEAYRQMAHNMLLQRLEKQRKRDNGRYRKSATLARS